MGDTFREDVKPPGHALEGNVTDERTREVRGSDAGGRGIRRCRCARGSVESSAFTSARGVVGGCELLVAARKKHPLGPNRT
jgi:hypothetical protein